MIYVIKAEHDRYTTSLGGYRYMSAGNYYIAELVELDDRFCQGWYYRFKDDENYLMHVTIQLADPNQINEKAGFFLSEIYSWDNLSREEKDFILMIKPEIVKEFGYI